MQDIWPELRSWFLLRERFALATVVRASKPSPRGVGSVLAIHEDGERFIGSVSAGCVENEVIEAAKRCLADGKTRWLSFGPGEGFPWEIELSCGGSIEVRIDPAPHLRPGGEAFVEDLIVAMDAHEAIVWRASETSNSLIEADPENLDTREIVDEGERILYRALRRRRRLFVVGASHIALHLVAAAKMLQYEVVVVDPRESYARSDRFQSRPDRVLVDWPDRALADYELGAEDSLVAITHDPKIDDNALAFALNSKCGYIGALGSRKSHAARLRRLAKLGFSETELGRVFGPVGLDIGSRTPAEIAISIVAQLIQERWRGETRR